MESGNAKSSLENIVCGVPQGSILGPLLLVTCMNDICNVSNILKFVLLADDTTIFTSDKNVAKLFSETIREINKLYTWLSVNKLSINIKNTNYIAFSNIHENVACSVGINNIKFQRVYLTKFLRVFIDHKLTWKEHINYVCGNNM